MKQTSKACLLAILLSQAQTAPGLASLISSQTAQQQLNTFRDSHDCNASIYGNYKQNFQEQFYQVLATQYQKDLNMSIDSLSQYERLDKLIKHFNEPQWSSSISPITNRIIELIDDLQCKDIDLYDQNTAVCDETTSFYGFFDSTFKLKFRFSDLGTQRNYINIFRYVNQDSDQLIALNASVNSVEYTDPNYVSIKFTLQFTNSDGTVETQSSQTIVGNLWDIKDQEYLLNILYDYNKGYSPVLRFNLFNIEILHTFDQKLIYDYLTKKYLLNDYQQFNDSILKSSKLIPLANISAEFKTGIDNLDDNQFVNLFNRYNLFDTRQISAQKFEKEPEYINWKINTRGITKSRWGQNKYFYVYRDAAYGKIKITNIHNIEQCESSFFPLFKVDENNQQQFVRCELDCPYFNGYVQHNQACISCNKDCKECEVKYNATSDLNYISCLVCRDDHYIKKLTLPNGNVIQECYEKDECKSNQYFNTLTKQCQDCKQTFQINNPAGTQLVNFTNDCATCQEDWFDLGRSYCLSCVNQQAKLGRGKCFETIFDQCPIGSYKVQTGGTDFVCKDCPHECDYCAEDKSLRIGVCTLCRDGFVQTDDNFGNILNGKECTACKVENCKKCSSVDLHECIECFDNHPMFDDKCLGPNEACPVGTFKLQIPKDTSGLRFTQSCEDYCPFGYIVNFNLKECVEKVVNQCQQIVQPAALKLSDPIWQGLYTINPNPAVLLTDVLLYENYRASYGSNCNLQIMYSDDLTISVVQRTNEQKLVQNYLNVVKHSTNVSSMTIRFDQAVKNYNQCVYNINKQDSVRLTYREYDETRDIDAIISYKGTNLYESNGWIQGVQNVFDNTGTLVYNAFNKLNKVCFKLANIQDIESVTFTFALDEQFFGNGQIHGVFLDNPMFEWNSECIKTSTTSLFGKQICELCDSELLSCKTCALPKATDQGLLQTQYFQQDDGKCCPVVNTSSTALAGDSHFCRFQQTIDGQQECKLFKASNKSQIPAILVDATSEIKSLIICPLECCQYAIEELN